MKIIIQFQDAYCFNDKYICMDADDTGLPVSEIENFITQLFNKATRDLVKYLEVERQQHAESSGSDTSNANDSAGATTLP